MFVIIYIVVLFVPHFYRFSYCEGSVQKFQCREHKNVLKPFSEDLT